MARTYQVNQSADIADFVRVQVRDGSNNPVTGLSFDFILRDDTGTSLSTASVVELAGGWYRPASLVLPSSGTYTIEFDVAAPNMADSDSAVIQVPDTNPLRQTIRDTAVIGETYRFNILFTDRDNAPIDVTLPSIHIYNFDPDTGTRTTVVAPGTALSVLSPAETGRYTHTHLVDAASTEGSKLYAEVQGADPTAGGLGLIRQDYVLDLQAVRVPGLGHSFIP